ncbi:MAG: hypothetical protein QM605_08010 [Sphingobium sp.]
MTIEQQLRGRVVREVAWEGDYRAVLLFTDDTFLRVGVEEWNDDRKRTSIEAAAIFTPDALDQLAARFGRA